MPDAEPINYRLSDLKLRWQRDPSSRLFLQLANEHRKAGQIEEAITVLEQGLEHRPNDLSALVVLGRSRLELELADEAVEPLETVISKDPAHLVASKLLIEAHLQRGDAAQASEQLRQYRLLNDRDPELDHLQYRLERLQAEDEQEAPTAVGELEIPPAVGAVEPEPDVPPRKEAPEPIESEPVSADTLSEPAPAEVSSDAEAAPAEVSGPASPAPAAALPAPAAAPAAPAEDGNVFALTDESPAPDLEALWRTLPTQRPAVAEPFVGLSSLDATSHWDLLSQEGIFASPGAPAEAEPAIEPEPVVEPQPVVEAEPAIEPEPVVEAQPVVGAEPAIEPEPVFELQPATEAAPEPEPALDAEPAPEAAAAVDAAEPVTESTPEQSVESAGEEPATVTLGELYLRQGHQEEAKRIFEQVLKQDPGNRTALDNLARLDPQRPDVAEPVAAPPDQRRSRRQLSAADLLAVRSASARIPEGLTAKKVLVLSNYLKHLRTAVAQDHVS